MDVILILLSASLLIAGAFLGAFIWSVRNGQYDDDYTPSVRMLFDDKKPTQELKEQQQTATPNKLDGTTTAGG
jgi:cbb3-type cytochrome oxidase maturation protein